MRSQGTKKQKPTLVEKKKVQFGQDDDDDSDGLQDQSNELSQNDYSDEEVFHNDNQPLKDSQLIKNLIEPQKKPTAQQVQPQKQLSDIEPDGVISQQQKSDKKEASIYQLQFQK